MSPLIILWRGPLSSCNYDCPYCPFRKRPIDKEELRRDERALERFLGWAERHDGPLSVFFTPWGEALVHAHYQEALVALSRLPHLRRAAIQTNLSARLTFLSRAQQGRVGLWSTYHPGEVRLERFVAKAMEARGAGARISAGVVGQLHHLEEIEALRRALPRDVYLWINAVRGVTYDDDTRARLHAVDPLFAVNLARPYPSLGRACRAGETAISVDGDGVVRRCHFLPEVLGNLYEDELSQMLRPRPCPKETCDCHIGYVHLDELRQYDVYGEGLLERIPSWWGKAETDASVG
jgi:MoaA/NifB/PqqE/SkfB family radical SAM enzyme